jgi:tetratricopeptide (TPR) repeat protein
VSVSPRVTVFFALLLAVCFGGSAVAARRLEQLRPYDRLQDPLIIHSGKALRRLSLGYRGLLADIYWTRAVQYFGEKHLARANQYSLLAPFLDMTTDLDPQLIVAYQFGSIFLSEPPPEGAGQPDKAVALVEKGIQENPDKWQLYYGLGWIEYSRGNYLGASRAFERGSRVRGANPSLKTLAAVMAQNANDIRAARFLWSQIYETTEDRMVRGSAIKHLQALQVDEDVASIEKAVQHYRTTEGHPPSSVRELRAMGWQIPQADPLGHTYRITSDGRVEVADPASLPFITRGLPPTQNPSLLRPLSPAEQEAVRKAAPAP